jgi:hypothetical protein
MVRATRTAGLVDISVGVATRFPWWTARYCAMPPPIDSFLLPSALIGQPPLRCGLTYGGVMIASWSTGR